MHPQFEQSGLPPNWHGVIGVSKSAETHVVVLANTHDSGVSGGSVLTAYYGLKKRAALDDFRE